MTVQQNMGQQSFQPQPGYGHPMMGQMGPMNNQFGPYMPMGGIGPMMGMGQQNRQPMGKTPSELGLGPSDPSAIQIPNAQSATTNVDPLPKDQSLEDGKRFLLYIYMILLNGQWHALLLALLLLLMLPLLSNLKIFALHFSL